MSEPLERLRRLQGLRRQKQAAQPDLPSAGSDALVPSRLSQTLLPGAVIDNAAGACYVTVHRFSVDDARGPQPLGALLGREPVAFASHHPDFALNRQLDFTQAIFLDTETTGLGGGAGVYAFMVGVGTFEAGSRAGTLDFVVRQFFMRNPAEEAALLVALTDLLSRYAMTVTFNGRTFDLPLLRGRVRANSWAPGLDFDGVALLEPARPHLDLLHPARRMWRRRLQSCRLVNLETQILGLQRTDDDVPGHLIPQIYLDYMRSDDATDVNRVFYHNREDIVSMVALAEHLVRLYAGTPDELSDADLVGEDWTSLGRLHEQRGDLAAAETAYRQALATVRAPAELAYAFAALGQLLKRAQRWDEAVALWQQWISTVPGNDLTPYVELAKFCEWQQKDVDQAAMWTGWALHNLRDGPRSAGQRAAREDLEHRLARLQRKQGGQ